MSTRVRLLAAALMLLWGAVAVRLVHLQVRRHESFSENAVAQQARDEVLPARLGNIVDRHGRLLATSTRCFSLFVDPSRVADPNLLAVGLADPCGLDAEQLAERIRQNPHRRFLWVKRRLTDDEAARVLDRELPERAWGLREEFRRVYPHGTLAAHVLGWRNIDGVPQAGVERTLDHLLQGTDGRRTIVRDARGYVIEVLQEIARPPQHGRTVTLTLDAEIQRIVEDRLDRLIEQWRPQSASAIVMDPHSGQILAMGVRPTFDPMNPSAAGAESWTNYAVSSAYEPGSTIKPCIASWAIDCCAIASDDTFSCNGTYRMGRRTLHDHRAYGMLDVAGVIARSSNIGMARIGERLGNDGLYAAVSAFGFGRPTGIELPGESSGIVRPLDRWDAYSTGSVPMGQEIAATPLQIIAAHAALANGGLLISPHLVLNAEDSDRHAANVLAKHILASQTARWIVSGPMVEAVRIGTARRAAIEGLSVFAKTGTAQKFDASTGAYADDRYVCSCVCGAPADAPRVLVLVTVDEPTAGNDPSGGAVAAPAAADILRHTLPHLDALGPSELLLRMALERGR